MFCNWNISLALMQMELAMNCKNKIPRICFLKLLFIYFCFNNGEWVYQTEDLTSSYYCREGLWAPKLHLAAHQQCIASLPASPLYHLAGFCFCMFTSSFPLHSAFPSLSCHHLTWWHCNTYKLASLNLILDILGNSASYFLATNPKCGCSTTSLPNSETCHAPYGSPCAFQGPLPGFRGPPYSSLSHTSQHTLVFTTQRVLISAYHKKTDCFQDRQKFKKSPPLKQTYGT